jgi:integrase
VHRLALQSLDQTQSRDLYLHPSLLPLQFPSIEHFDARIGALLTNAATIEDLSSTTTRWMLGSYRAFRQYLETTARSKSFIGGDLQRQVRTVEEWPAHERRRDIARPTINNYWRGMRGLCTRLLREDGTVNPFVFSPAPHPGDPSLRFLTQIAAEEVLAFVQNDLRDASNRARNTAIIGIMLLAGLRRAEVLRLRASHLDFDGKVIHVIGGKGRHGGKNRTVPMTPQLFGILDQYKTERETIDVAYPEFFLGTYRRGPLSEITLRRLFQRISSVTGIHVTPHMLRHTFCTLLAKAGVSDRLAKDAMGHADYTTLQRYQHVYEGELATEMAKLRLNIQLAA